MTYTGKNYQEIEEGLIRLGATAEEADALTDILHEEGWGGEEDSELTDEVLSAKIDWLREFRPVDPRADWDDSNYIDIIESAKSEWFESHPECDTQTSEDTDASINVALGLPSCGSLRGLSLDLANTSEHDIRASVKQGLDDWFSAVSEEL